MSNSSELTALSKQVEAILCPPFEWCAIPGGTPEYLRATDRGVGWSPRGQLNDCGLRIALQLP